MNTKLNYILIVAAFILTASVYSTAIAQSPSGQNQLLAQARAATAVYHDINEAFADGFVQSTACHGDANGAVGISYVNIARFVSPEVSELEPEFLNYIPTDDGDLRLVSVAYSNRVLFHDTRSSDTPGYRPGIFVWQQPVIPPYLEEVSGAFSVFGEPAHGPIFMGRWFYIVTVNIWRPNPLGMFADGNPQLHCPE
jgi:hypothetical protein